MKKRRFPLIGTHFQQFVKPWPCSVSHQEVEQGTPKARESTWKVMRLSITQDSPAGSRQGAGGTGYPRREESALWKYPSVQSSKETSDLTQKPALCPQRPRAGLTPSPWRPGALGSRTQLPGRDPAASLAATLLVFHWGGEEGGPIHKYAKKEEDGFLSGKHRQEEEPIASCPCFLSRPKWVQRLLGCLTWRA